MLDVDAEGSVEVCEGSTQLTELGSVLGHQGPATCHQVEPGMEYKETGALNRLKASQQLNTLGTKSCE